MTDSNPFRGRAFVIAPDDEGNLRVFNDLGEPLPIPNPDDLQDLQAAQPTSRGSTATGIIRQNGRCFIQIQTSTGPVLFPVPCP